MTSFRSAPIIRVELLDTEDENLISRYFKIAALAGILLAGNVFAAQVPFPDADKERAAAIEAEKNGDLAAATLHYENIYDSTKTDQLTRVQLMAKLAELKSKIAPNTDPAKAAVWKCKVFVIRTVDFNYKDKDGKEHHVVHNFTEDNINDIRTALKGFQDRVWEYTDGNLRVDVDLVVLERKYSNYVFDKDWGYCAWADVTMPVVADQLKFGEADTVMVFIKTWLNKGEEGEPLPCYFLGDTTGIQACTKGATYMIFNAGSKQCVDPTGEVQLHEWLHAVDMSMAWVHGYPKDGPMDWTSDGGDSEVANGCYKLEPNQKGWMPFYKHEMREHVTRKMWQDSPIYKKSDNPWLNDYVRDFLVLGTFAGKDKPAGGLEQAFIDESKVTAKLGAKAGGKKWKLASAPGKFPNFANIIDATASNQVCYASFAIESEKEQTAVIKMQRDGGCKMWQDGKLILDSPFDRTWDTDPNTIDVKLKPGKNVFLIKLNNVACDWAFNVKVTGTDNNMLPNAKFTLP